MFCYQCGKEQADSSNFCSGCGAARIAVPNPPSIENAEPATSTIVEVKDQEDVIITTDLNLNDAQEFSSRTHPWRRYFAHLFDIVILGMMGSFALGVLLYTIFPDSSSDLDAFFENPIVSLMLIYLAAIPLESALLSSTGTTLGKGVFGVQVTHLEGRLLSFSEALQRGFTRWLRAEGLGIPIIILFTNMSAYRRLTNYGVTTYDESLKVSVKHKQWGPGRAIVATLSIFLVFLLITLMNAMLAQT